MAEKISIQIALEGGDEVEKQLAAIGAAGEKAFDQINKAADQVEIEKVGEASQTAAEGIDQVAAASDRAGAEISKTHEAVNKVIGAFAQLVQATAKVVVDHETLIRSLLRLHGAFSTTSRVLAALTPELGLVGVTFGSTAAAVAGGAIAFETLRKAAETAAGPLAKLSQDLTTLSANTGETFDNLQRGRAAFEQLGISGENFAGIITKINEGTKDFDVGAKLKESADKALEAEKALIEAQLKLNSVATIGAQGPADAAQRLLDINNQLTGVKSDQAKAEEAASNNAKALANDLKAIIPIVNQIAAGQKGLTFDGLTTAATKIDALTAAMKKAGDSSKTAGQVLVSFIASADRLSAIQVGKQFGLTEEQVDRLQRSGGHLQTIDEIWRRIQGAGVLIPPESAGAIAQLQVEMDAVAQAKVRLDQAMSSTVIQTWAAQVSSLLNGLKAQLLNMAATDVEAVNRAFTTLGATNPFANTISELEAIGRLLTSIGGQATDFSWGEIVATGGLASTREELEAIGRVITSIAGQTTSFTWGELWQTGGLASTRQELEGIGGVLDSLIQKFLKLIGLKGSGGAPAPAAAGGGQFARGGLLGGRGSGTSDSNLAWVSRGEHIMPARAVAQPGVLAFLEALRRSGGNLSRALDGMGRFALGGMIRGPMPAFANGGLAGGMSNVTIQFPGLPAIGGLRASSDVVDQLHRAAALAQVRSGGRKPSRYS
jgi:hypothetical protein